MTRPELVKHIRERLKVEYELEASRELVNAILSIEEDEIYTIVALNDNFKYLWGTISGVSKPPKKVAGKFSEIKSVKDNFGYSTWKDGYPKIKWSNIMKVYDIHPPEDYFALPENRYTTEARIFRQDAGLPEIPEYENLSEAKIQEYCKRADALKVNKMTATERRNKQRDDKYNKLKTLAIQDYWIKTNYTPMGATDKNWTGEQVDTVDCYLSCHLPESDNPVDKLETVRIARDIGEWKNEAQNHPELDELEAQFLKEIEELNLTPINHVKKEFKENAFTLKYKGEEDPWGIMNVSTQAELKRKRVAKEEQELLNDINSEKKEKE